ncbi:MAG: radical SAM protein [Halanaerobiales bacterium]|nr:radical SAM protein [Halanaerobiales bacterium]
MEIEELIDKIKINFKIEDTEEILETLFQLLKDFAKENYISIETKVDTTWKKINNDILETLINTDQSFIKIRGEMDFEPITDVDLVITQKCNFKCKHCFMSSSPETGNKDKLDTTKWKEIIDSLCKLGLSEAKVTGGEPFVHSEIFEILEHLDSKNVGILILSNGFLLNQKIVEKLSNLKKVFIQISIDGISDKSYDALRNTTHVLGKIKENIILLRKHNIPIIISTTATIHNYEEILSGQLIELAKKLDINILGVSPHFIQVGRATENMDNQLTDHQILKLIDYLNQEKEKNYPFKIHIGAPPALTGETTLKHLDLALPRCRRGINSCSITSEGLVAVCTDFVQVNYDKYKLGNVLENNLETIWKNAKQIREERINSIGTLKGVCTICKHVIHCGGACRADAYAFYKDINAPYPLCQRLYENNKFPKDSLNKDAKYIPIR